MCNKAVISQHRSGIIPRQFEQQMPFHGHGVLCPAPLSANHAHAKVCEAHLGSKGHCRKHPPWTNNMFFSEEMAILSLLFLFYYERQS